MITTQICIAKRSDNFSFIPDGFLAHSFTKVPRLQGCFWRIYDWLGENDEPSKLLHGKS